VASPTDGVKRRVHSAGTTLGRRPHITRLLVQLGFQPERVMRTRWAQTHDPSAFNPLTQRRRGRCQSFWTHHESELHEILAEAHGRYHELAKTIRTDLTENHRKAVALNVAWQRVKALFARKGIVWTKGQ
jgi:hypothetical protein